MGCYSGACVSTAKKVVGIISIMLCLLGLVFVIVGFAQSGAVDMPDDIGNNLPSTGALSLGGLNTFLGLVVIVIGLLGIGAWKKSNPCCTVPFALLSFIIGLVVLIIGFLIVGLAGTIVNEVQEMTCNSSQGLQLAQTYNNVVGMNMCTDLCPCDPGEGDATKTEWNSLEESFYAQYGRTKADMVWAANAGEGFNDFYTCYDTNIVGSPDNADADAVKSFFVDDIGEGIKLLEDQYDCAGYCQIGMFSVSRSIEEGVATEDCLNASIDALQSSSVPVGVVGIISGLVLLVAFCFSFPLCCKSCIREEDKQIM